MRLLRAAGRSRPRIGSEPTVNTVIYGGGNEETLGAGPCECRTGDRRRQGLKTCVKPDKTRLKHVKTRLGAVKTRPPDVTFPGFSGWKRTGSLTSWIGNSIKTTS